MDAADLKQGRQGSSREQAVERVTKPCGRKVPGAGRARVNRTSVAACVERKESPREELARLCRPASSVQGPEGRRNLRRGARADLKPSTRERSDGKTSRPGPETVNGAEDSGELSRPDTSRSHFQNPPRKWWSLMIISEQDRKPTRECRIRGNAGSASRRVSNTPKGKDFREACRRHFFRQTTDGQAARDRPRSNVAMIDTSRLARLGKDSRGQAAFVFTNRRSPHRQRPRWPVLRVAATEATSASPRPCRSAAGPRPSSPRRRRLRWPRQPRCLPPWSVP